MEINRFKRFLPARPGTRLLAGVLLLVLAASAVFFCRAPALLISDGSFDFIYGAGRTLAGQIGLSLRLFRRVKRVGIAENADPEAMVFAIEEKEKRPWAVLGHSRYSRGLGQYARQRTDVRVIVAGEDPGPAGRADRSGAAPGEGGPELVFPDVRLNSWRLGRCAALLAGETEGMVLVFQNGQNFPVQQEAFLAGLREENANLLPLYLSPSSDYSSWEQVRCVVLGGGAEAYFSRVRDIPALLYSWMDPALSPSSVKLICDDSLWALACQALRVPAGDSPYRTVPAAFTVLRGRVGDSALRAKLKKALRAQIPQVFPDYPP
jgi:hypothetical protein